MNSFKKINGDKKDVLLSNIINAGTVILFFVIAIAIYYVFFDKSAKDNRFELFTPEIDYGTDSEVGIPIMKTDTIYEKSLKKLYSSNPRLVCSVLSSSIAGSSVCIVDGEKYVIYNFPIHMIKLIDGTILAVFNDGRLYQKDNIENTMWQGPLDNSLPNDSIPLRMISLTTDLNSLLGVGFDNKLYIKKPDMNGNLNLKTSWQIVPNNSNIIYVIFDNNTGAMISIDVNGRLLIKPNSDITNNSTELVNKVDRPILRLYYDLNGYMLAIDDKFDLYQFSELNWKNSKLNTKRGANSSKLHDVLYNTDGRMFGLVFNPDSFILQLMKQDTAFYLGNFQPLEIHLNTDDKGEFVMSDQDIIKSKVGNINPYLQDINGEDLTDDDPNVAYQKQLLDTKAKLINFCSNRNSTTNSNVDNYELLGSVEQNNVKITHLRNIVKNLINAEPDNKRILDKYPFDT